NRYWNIVEQMLATGKAGLSSGTIGHLARRKGSEITRWPIVEESITLTPAEPRTVDGVTRLKHLVEANPELEAIVTEADGTPAVGDAATDEAEANQIETTIQIVESDDMAEETQAKVTALTEKVDGLSEGLNKIMEVMENSPALKRAGYTTDDGGAADETHKSFGDFLLAIKRRDAKRLAQVYKAQRDDGDTKDMAEAAGATGGYLVPAEHLTPLLRLAGMNSPVYQRVNRVPVRTDAGEWPALDQFVAPTAGSGNTALAGGITSTTTAEAAALTETQATFVNIEYRVHKIGGYVEVSNELIADSPESIEALLTSLFGIAVGARNERNILRGTGVGEPLGILNAPSVIGVTTATDNVFALADALSMRSRFKSVGGSPVWIIHPGIWPDIGVFETSAGGGVWMANQAASMPSSLLGYPILESEHMPAPNTDDVILADLSAYVLFERQALSIAFSEHAAFTTDKGTWRFTVRNDGQPWLKSAITLADPGGSFTVSPFVYHND
ncbi:MAG TPA: phage major capsid protein, partial [Promineifilum sp.]